MRRLVGLLALGVLVVAPGCGTTRSGAFAPVQSQVRARTGVEVDWPRPRGLEVPVDARVRELLARPLTAESACEVALAMSRELQAAFEELGISRAELLQAALPRNPTFDQEIRFGGGGHAHSTELALVQDVTDLLYRSRRQGVARAELAGAQAAATGAVVDLLAEVREAFYRAQAAEQLLVLRHTVLDAMSASAEVARRLRAAGNLSEFDAAQEQALLEQARLDVTQAEAERAAARARLDAECGLWGDLSGWTLEARLPDPPAAEVDLAQVEGKALESSLDLEIARRDLEAARRGYALARARGAVPRLGLGISGDRDESGHWGFGPALAVGVPLFDRGQGRSEAMRARGYRSEDRLAAVGVRIRAAARTLAALVASSRSQAEHLRDVVLPLRKRLVDEAQLRYNAMAIGVFQLLQVRRSEVAGGVRYVEALRDYWVAKSELDALLQGRLRAALPEGGRPSAVEAGSGEEFH